MTTTHDPTHPLYLDEADVRAELTRVFDICQGCQRCVALCSSFPSLFEMIDRRDVPDAGLLTPADQDRVVDECWQCTLCHANCPYTPDLHEWNVDFPRLMLRAAAMQRASGITSARSRLTTQVTGRTDLLGTVAGSTAIARRIANAAPGSSIRRAVSKVAGVSPTRLLPPYAKQRFSTWFERRTAPAVTDPQGRVTVYPTCLVEYHETGIGKDLVKVYEHNGIECRNSAAGCCGAPWLHAGHLETFTKVARKNVATLAAEVRAGTEIVVPQPTCSHVIRKEYVHHVGGPDAELVAEHTHDAVDYLMKVHTADDTTLDTSFPGETVETVAYHVACHLRAQELGPTTSALLELTGAQVTLVQQCSGTGAMWGLRSGNEPIAVPVATQLAAQIERAGGDAVAGDCHLANTAILEQTGRPPRHPLQIVARAYGIADD
jgi:glycerol-3-phosphate dehydrogenase subunit C